MSFELFDGLISTEPQPPSGFRRRRQSHRPGSRPRSGRSRPVARARRRRGRPSFPPCRRGHAAWWPCRPPAAPRPQHLDPVLHDLLQLKELRHHRVEFGRAIGRVQRRVPVKHQHVLHFVSFPVSGHPHHCWCSDLRTTPDPGFRHRPRKNLKKVARRAAGAGVKLRNHLIYHHIEPEDAGKILFPHPKGRGPASQNRPRIRLVYPRARPIIRINPARRERCHSTSPVPDFATCGQPT